MVVKTRPVRFGVLGAARIAPKALIQPAEQLDCAEIVAVAARDPLRARAFAAANHIPQVLSSYDELIATADVDAVYVPLPNSLHCEWTIRAIRSGKHVLCEKPIASNTAEAERMALAASENGLVLAEALHYRYHPLAARIRELLDSGSIGRIIRFEGHFSAPNLPSDIRFDWDLAGGAMMDLGCYPLNMIRYFSGQLPRVQHAKAEVGPPGIDITMDVELELEQANAHISCSMAPGVRGSAWFRAIGEKGELLVTNPVAPHLGNLITVRSSSRESHETVQGHATYVHQLEAFVAAIRGEKPIATPASDGVVNMRLIDDIYRAAGLPCRGESITASPIGRTKEAPLK